MKRSGWILVAVMVAIAGLLLLSRKRPSRNPPVAATPLQPHSAPTNLRAAAPPSLPLRLFNDDASLRPSASPAALAAQLRDSSLPERQRRAAALELARLGTDDALATLKAVLGEASATPTLKAAIAEALGECPHGDARALLHELLKAPDETVARGAIRGLAHADDGAALNDISGVLNDDRQPASLRTEAALALGGMEQSGALEALRLVLTKVEGSELARDVLEGIGRRPFEETRDFFTDYLRGANVPAESRRAALEALAQTPGDPSQLLLAYAKDSDPKARAAAAWALSVSEDARSLGPQLVSLLQNEPEPAVRSRLYQALARQENFDVPAVQAGVSAEKDLSTRLEGYNALASAAKNPDAAKYFDERAVPELAQTALNGGTLQHRLASVVALQRAATPAAKAALENVAQGSGDARVTKAAQAALRLPRSVPK